MALQRTADIAVSDSPKYLDKLPCAKHAYADVVDVIHAARQSIQNMVSQTNFVEVELRFGRRDQGFRPGISAEAFQLLEARFDTGRDWADRRDWHNITVYFHSSSVPGDHRKLRTEVTFFPEGHPEAKRVECTHKEVVCNHDYRTVSMMMDAPATHDLRIAVNVEHAVPPSDIPEITEPHMVHLKTRKCYFYAPTGYEVPVWAYVLTKRWTGRNLLEAKQSQARDTPVYEVELECLHPEYLSAIDAGQVAAKILYKACDLLELLSPHNRSEYVIEPIGKSMLWTRHKLP